MKKVFKFVKGKKDERKESGGITPSQSGDLLSPAQTPEDERFLGLENSSGYVVDFSGKDKTLTKLHKAAWQGNLEKLKSALKKVDVNAVDRHNRTALHFAVAQGHPNIVWFLLGNNAKVSICDDDGHTPLLKAIECRHKECMTLLLDRGADVNVSDYTGNTGLHIAVGQASLDTVSALLHKGADTEVSNNAGDYPLHIATRLENKDLVHVLLEAGASVDVLDRENRTPLMLSAKTGNSLLAQMFVERGAQLTVVDSNGWTAQDYAMLGGHENVATTLKSFSKSIAKKPTKAREEPDSAPSENSESWGDSQTDASDKVPITQKIKKFFEKCSEEESEPAEREKSEELPESPEPEAIPPYCQPPRSWEMIQAGMIDENKDGVEPKRRSITTLGTLHSRRESFTEGTTTSPQFTLSLNRRKCAKRNNDFAKQRFSFNEEQSLKYWINEEKTIRKDVEKLEFKNALTEPKQSVAESDWDSISIENSQDSKEPARSDSRETSSLGSQKLSSKNSDNGTLGREGTMRGADEMWVINSQLTPQRTLGEEQGNSWDSEDASFEKESSFPPPPTALELGVDMAKSIRYMKGMSVDRAPGGASDRNLWKNVYESHSLDRLEEKCFTEASRENETKLHHFLIPQRGEDFLKCQKPGDRFLDVNKRINEQLECYDQALRELAETSKPCQKPPPQNYYSLPFTKTGGGCACRRASCQELTSDVASRLLERGPPSLPLCGQQWAVENNEKLGSEAPTNSPPEEKSVGKATQKLEKKTKRHILLAMRDVKHAVHVTNSFKTSMDDQILSPLAKPELDFELEGNSTPKGASSSSEGNSPPDENPFFGMGRQETVLERNEVGRKSSSSGTGEESTLWLQDEARGRGHQCQDSDDEVSEIMADERTKHRRVSSFSPLGIIQREMEEESRGKKSDVSGECPAEERPLSLSEELCGENEEQNEEILREPSPDISLSSGPIEPIGADKDSGSEPESSHNDASSTHNYAFRSQHEWLKSHLKAATSEKNKLEELTAQLSEKAERLQYELADAREAAKSRDEVIQLLQGQLARMEAAYTKSLEESVQSRLQLTSHEQEILHLKELCFRYEEEKETPATGTGGDFLQELQLRIKNLEEEKEKMREEIINLEEEKSLLKKRLKEDKNEESDIIDQCQRWQERCGKLEEMAKVYDSKQAAYESYVKEKDREYLRQENELKQQNFQLENKCMKMNEENIELNAKIQFLALELEAEKRKTSARNEKNESISDLKRKNVELEIRLKELEKDMEEKMVKKLKEKEEEIEGLLTQFNRERSSLIASYEKKLAEKRRGEGLPDQEEWKSGSHHLRQMVENLQERLVHMHVSSSVEDTQATLKNELNRLRDEWISVLKSIKESQEDPRRLNSLATENLKLSREVNELKGKVAKSEEMGGTVGSSLEAKTENAEVKSEILELRRQVNSLRMLLDDRWTPIDVENQKNFERRMTQRSEGRRKGVGKEDELAWSSLYGMKTSGRRGGRSTSVTEALMKDSDIGGSSDEGKNRKPSSENIFNRLNGAKEQESEISNKFQTLEFLELKKEILSLQGKMTDEKNLRHALENQMIKMNLDLTEKDNLEKEVNSLKKKVDRDYMRRSDVELLEFQRELEARRESYLRGQDPKDVESDYKAKCEILAKEREKSKEMRLSFGRRAKSFDCPPAEASPQLKFHSCPRPLPELFMQPRFAALDPDIKTRLEMELDKSIKKYTQETSLASSSSNVPIELVKKKYF